MRDLADKRVGDLAFADRTYLSGYAAYEANIGRGKCPLARGSMARESWCKGWDDARRDYEVAFKEGV